MLGERKPELYLLPSQADLLILSLGLKKASTGWAGGVGLLLSSISQPKCVQKGMCSFGLAVTQATAWSCSTAHQNLCLFSVWTTSVWSPLLSWLQLQDINWWFQQPVLSISRPDFSSELQTPTSNHPLESSSWTHHTGASFSKPTLSGQMGISFSAYMWTIGFKLEGGLIKETWLMLTLKSPEPPFYRWGKWDLRLTYTEPKG